MTRFTHTPLCSFPAGPKSGTQTRKAKELIRQAVPGGKVSLLSVTDVQEMTHSVVAFFDASDALAVAWVSEAEKVAKHVREVVAGMGSRELVR